MRAPLSWLRDFAPFPDDTGALVAALDDLGLVVEEVDRVGQGLEAVVVSRVAEIHAIEGADRIRRIVVEAGGEPLDIVCGAFNFEVGDRVPLAPVGAVLPGGFEIGRRKMRGVLSNGMLCSGRELGLSDDGAGLLVLGEEVDAPPGTPLIEALGLPVDTVFDITVEGNRPDAWCMAGVARDLAARLGLPFELPEPPAPEPSGRPVADAATRRRRGPRSLPAPDGVGLHRRRRRTLSGVDRPAPRPGRHAPHQQRGGRIELRDARTGAAHPPLRPGAAGRAWAGGPPGTAR